MCMHELWKCICSDIKISEHSHIYQKFSVSNPKFKAVWELLIFALFMTELFYAVLSLRLGCWNIFIHMEK